MSAYASLSDLRDYLKIDSSADNELLADLIQRASKIIDRYCKQTFAADTNTTRYFDAVANVSGRTLYLFDPLAAINTVTNGDGVVVASNEYVTEPRNETPYYALTLKTNVAKAWTYTGAPENAIAISGKWAYSETPPDDIVAATIRLSAYLYHQKSNNADLDRAVFVGNSTLLPTSLPADIRQILIAPLRRVTI